MASPVGPLFVEVAQVLERALGIYERLGDRTGVMSTVIAMAYARYGPVMHLVLGAAPRGDPARDEPPVRAVTESERDRLDLQMLFGVHVYSRPRWSRTSRCPEARMPIGRPGSRAIGRSSSSRRAAWR